MTQRRKALTTVDIENSELPANRPALLESASSNAKWHRERLNAMDERDLVDAQIQSASRLRDHTVSEADSIRSSRIAYAETAFSREANDANAIMETTVSALEARKSDLDKIIAGLGAAIDAIGQNKPDSVQSGE